MKGRAYRTEKFYRWVWDAEGEYTTRVTHDHADQYCWELAEQDLGQWTKCSYQKALKMLFRWRAHAKGDERWEPEFTFSQPTDNRSSRDYLTKEERQKFREAVTVYEEPPHYESLDPGRRERYKQYVADQLGKHPDAVGVDDWEKVQSWKYTSLVWASLDTGLRPIEVERAETSWVQPERQQLRIPAEASKNGMDWEPVLREQTAEALELWLTERLYLPKYDDSDALWLTKNGNRYDSQSLSRLAKRIADAAGIPRENRQITWYSIRRGLATAMINEADLSTAQTQLRHRDPRSTMRYDAAPAERRRDTLNRLD